MFSCHFLHCLLFHLQLLDTILGHITVRCNSWTLNCMLQFLDTLLYGVILGHITVKYSYWTHCMVQFLDTLL